MLGLIDVISTLQIHILHLNINTSDTFISNIQWKSSRLSVEIGEKFDSYIPNKNL